MPQEKLASRWLVSTDWLTPASRAIRTSSSLDSSYYLANHKRDPRGAEFAPAHIPGARFFDIDEIAEQSSLPHMVPTAREVRPRSGAGHRRRHRVVVYDSAACSARRGSGGRSASSARRCVLDGGLPKWRAEGRPLESGQPSLRDRHFTARRRAGHGARRHPGRRLVQARPQIIDARAADRFRGEAPEPRPGLRSGHIPGSKNVPHDLVNPDGTMKDLGALRAMFEALAGVDVGKPAITTCGSGLSAAILALALERLGNRDWSVYDGSWAEWGGRPDTADREGLSAAVSLPSGVLNFGSEERLS